MPCARASKSKSGRGQERNFDAQTNTKNLSRTTRTEERAIILIQEIMGLSREAAEHTYMLIETYLTSIKTQDD